MKRFLTVLLLTGLPLTASAQNAGTATAGQLGPRQLLPLDQEVSLARSAAPASVSAEAAVWVFTEDGYRLAEPGTNDMACYVGRSWPNSIEPHCHDAEGAKTIMRIHMLETELRHKGMAMDSIERRINDGIATGELALPTRPAMSWMMSSAQELISDDGREVGAWEPHLMIYYPYLSAEETGLVDQRDLSHALLVSPDHATSNFMIVVQNAIDPTPIQQTMRD